MIISKKIKVGSVIIAENHCGFPDYTIKGKEYTVSKVNEIVGGEIMFWIIAEDGKERLPISTTFSMSDRN